MAIVRLPKGSWAPDYVGPCQIRSGSRCEFEECKPMFWARRVFRHSVRAGKDILRRGYLLYSDRACTQLVGEVDRVGPEVKVLPGLHI